MENADLAVGIRPDDARSRTRGQGPLIQVASGCASVGEFVDRFAMFASEGALELPASGELAVGTDARFMIVLRDRSVVMRGRCRVTDAKPAAPGKSGPGAPRSTLRVALVEMDGATRAVQARLLAAQRPPLPASPRSEVRPPRATVTLPANPFSQLGANDLASFVECTLFEVDAQGEGVVGDPTPPMLSSRPPSPAGARRAPLIALCFACVIVGIAGGLMLRRPNAARAPSADPVSHLGVAAAAPPVSSAPAPSAPASPAVERPSLTEEPTALLGGDCTVRITTEPEDAEVWWGDMLIGRSPIEEARVACGVASLTFRRQHYQPLTRAVVAEPGGVTSVSQQLHRLTATLIIGSSPPHAEITVNGQPLGAAPRRLDVPRFETVLIEATLAGHSPWKKTLYVRESQTRVGMKLSPLGPDDTGGPAVGEADTGADLGAGPP